MTLLFFIVFTPVFILFGLWCLLLRYALEDVTIEVHETPAPTKGAVRETVLTEPWRTDSVDSRYIHDCLKAATLSGPAAKGFRGAPRVH